MTRLQTSRAVADPRLRQGEDRPLSWLEIDLAAVAWNYRQIHALINHDSVTLDGDLTSSRRTGVCAVVKKDAYGLGMLPVVRTLESAGCAMLAVYCIEEAEKIAQAGTRLPILVFNPVDRFARTEAVYRLASCGLLHLSIHSLQQMTALNELARVQGLCLPVHLYLDTGISRAGLNREQFDQALQSLPACRHLTLAGLYSHLATADTDPAFARRQAERFATALIDNRDHLPAKVMRHLANSAGVLRGAGFHFDLVRPGITLSGFGPQLIEDTQAPHLEGFFKPALRWLSRLIHVQSYPIDTPVGYGSTRRLTRPSRLGTVPVGYADGYPLALSDRAVVRVLDEDGHTVLGEANVLGRVNMDQIVVDLTDLQPWPLPWPALLIEVISNDPQAPNSLPALARQAASHVYELQCGLVTSLPRHYLRGQPG